MTLISPGIFIPCTGLWIFPPTAWCGIPSPVTVAVLAAAPFAPLARIRGKTIVSRSADSILREVRAIVQHPNFHGTISDVGGPTANMYGLSCSKDEPCDRPSCLWPKRCPHLNASQTAYLKLLRRVETVPRRA